MHVQYEELLDEHLQAWRSEPGALLPLLHALQADLGYIPAESVPAIARALGLSRAEVHGVITFYHDFRTRPPGRHVLQVCRAEACQAQGARALETHAQAALGVGFGDTTADGAVTLEPVFCLGNCACGPSVRIDDAVHGRVDPPRLDALLALLAEGEA